MGLHPIEFNAMILSVLSTSTPLRQKSRVDIPKIVTMSSRLAALPAVSICHFYPVLARRVSTHAKYFIPRYARASYMPLHLI